jgi:hypothetical protein
MASTSEGKSTDLGVYECNHHPRKLYGVEYETPIGLQYYLLTCVIDAR